MVKYDAGARPSQASGNSVLDHVEELPRVRRLEAGLSRLKDLILARSAGSDIFKELENLRADLSLLEVGILKNHVQGCLRAAIKNGDDCMVDASIERIALQLQRLGLDGEVKEENS
jgi:DNA-binding FrmR family transcriptional regulator